MDKHITKMGEHWITNIDLSDRLQQKSDITVATLAERNAIGVWRRKWKMIVGVYNDGANNGFYSLEHDLNSTSLGDNDNWQLIDNHSRLHQMDSVDDHAPAAEADKNKIVASNAITGNIEFIEKTDVGKWEDDEITTIKPRNGKLVDCVHLVGTIDGGPLHP